MCSVLDVINALYKHYILVPYLEYRTYVSASISLFESIMCPGCAELLTVTWALDGSASSAFGAASVVSVY